MNTRTAHLLTLALVLSVPTTDGQAVSWSGTKDKVIGTLTGKPSTAKPLSTQQKPAGPLACDKGEESRADRKPCLPKCDENRENPVDGSKNCILPSTASQVGTHLKTAVQDIREGIRENQDTVRFNLENKIEQQKEGNQIDRAFRIDSDSSNSAASLGIGGY